MIIIFYISGNNINSLSNTVKVLIIIGSLDIGGAERHLARTLPELKKRGINISVWTLTHKGALSENLALNGIDVLPDTNNLHNKKQSRIIKITYLLNNIIHLFIYLVKNKYDIIHYFLPSAYLIGGIVSILSGQEIMVMSRRCLNNYQMRNPVFKPVEKRLHKYMAGFLCNSISIKQQLIEEGIPKHKIGVIYNGISEIESGSRLDYLSIKSKYHIHKNTMVMVKLANYIPHKGHSDLIAALGRIKDKLNHEWVLFCIGRDDGIMNELIDEAIRKGISKNIRFITLDDHVRDFLSISDISILCSHEEGFSNSILESMLEGLPVIASNVGGNPEAIVNGETGIIYQAGDINQLGNAILRLANNATLRNAMGDKGKNRVIEEFSQNKCTDAYETFYRGILKDPDANIQNVLEQH